MCGIAGKIFFRSKIVKDLELPLIKKTLSILKHRGPDDLGWKIFDSSWLGSTRLSIIDLSSAGHQPMSNEDGSLNLVFNGEIYNYKDLRKKLLRSHKFLSNTDSEVIIHLYEDFGAECLKFLRGMFAFAIWDSRKKEFFLARDRIGKKPIKYFLNKKFLIFASELKAFINHPGVPKEIDFDALDEFLTYQYVPYPKTGFKNILKLPPAHFMIVKANGEVFLQKYWEIDFSNKLVMSERSWISALTEKLMESVELRLQSDVPLGIHLSGGIDSSLITAFVCMQSKRRLKTFSLGYSNYNNNEHHFARSVSKRYNTIHQEININLDIQEILPKLGYEFEEPFADPSIVPTWYLMKETVKEVKVALNGDGGDENFGGYRRYQLIKIFEKLRFLPFKNEISSSTKFLYNKIKDTDIPFSAKSILFGQINTDIYRFYQDLVSYIPANIRSKFYTSDFRKKLSASRADSLIIEAIRKLPRNLTLLDKLLYTDILNYLPGVLLAKADLTSMSHSLEVRSPFLDQEFVELTSKMPSGFKLRNLTSKYILKKIARKYLPPEIILRRKQGFVPPIDDWLRVNLLDVVSSLGESKFVKYGLFDQKFLNKIVADHKTYKANNTFIIWTVLMLKNWLEVWFN